MGVGLAKNARPEESGGGRGRLRTDGPGWSRGASEPGGALALSLDGE
jgi:hypothetical protein